MDLLQSGYSSEEELEAELKDEVAVTTTPARTGTVTLSAEKVSGIRQQSHVHGNWAGLCFVPIRNDAIDQVHVDRLVSKLCHDLETLGHFGHCQLHNELHVSLSRPFYLQQANLQPFVQALSSALEKPSSSQPQGTRRRQFNLTIDPSESVILTNDDFTRSFLAWRVHAAELEQITNICSRILRTYQQPTFYDDPQFHVSLASFVPALNQDMSRMIGETLSSFDDDDDGSADCINFTVTSICVKFGTVQLFEIPLQLDKYHAG